MNACKTATVEDEHSLTPPNIVGHNRDGEIVGAVEHSPLASRYCGVFR
ncbi:hypothetical protein L915_03094 [Phytophthora nicotianae]|uniref:Uncharacterized protein n=1 Tax=Phytophthora nicotianae TaxID=4792 RepID=W2NY02_PHYNI|nr:hypothetical protein L915_03094 [Phytophthora nicotianae]ETL47163.1 hypothetical protein L916_03064 [Phytophthora nicotianae]ETM53456.1 hypothetical protein L914_03067 [Phytophthora nicotianae]